MGDAIDPMPPSPTRQNRDPRKPVKAQLESIAVVSGTTWPFLCVALTSQLQRAFSSVLIKNVEQRKLVLRALPTSSPPQGTAPTFQRL